MTSGGCRGVFVIDDDEGIRIALRVALAEEGYPVEFACNGSEGLAWLRQTGEHPCVILLDLMMPVMDGWSFREEQQKDPDLKDIPVVVMTADGRSRFKADAMDANGALAKPVRLAALLEVVTRYCG
jgi:CheY-like chemotaxis protein